jgi:hypothetical protein
MTQYLTVAVPTVDAGALTDAQIVAHILAWNVEPKGYPLNHRLYYYDSEKGWSYLTRAGWDVVPDAGYLAVQKASCTCWAEDATCSILDRLFEEA